MDTHSVVEAKNRLSDLIDRAQQGETALITRHGKPVAEIRALPAPAHPITRADLEWLAARRVVRRNPTADAGTLVGVMRDEEQR